MSFHHHPEQPFHEAESRYFLAEILKASDVPIADLVKTIQDRNVVPQWEQMALPNGRSLAACRHQFGLLTNRVSSMLLHPPAAQQSALGPPPPPLSYGRPPRPGMMPAPLVTSESVPVYTHHQYQFAPINDPGHPAAFQNTAYNPADTMDKTGKKRGRPSKQERELREAEARSRGEVYQPTKRKKPSTRPSGESGEMGASADPGITNKKPRRSSTDLEVAGPSPQSFPALSASVQTSPTDRMQVDTPERQDEDPGLRVQAPAPPAFRDLLSGEGAQGSRPVAGPFESPVPGMSTVREVGSIAGATSQGGGVASPADSGLIEGESTSGRETREASEAKPS